MDNKNRVAERVLLRLPPEATGGRGRSTTQYERPGQPPSSRRHETHRTCADCSLAGNPTYKPPHPGGTRPTEPVQTLPWMATLHINHLIQEARDPQNLCRLFPGWQPYI